MNEEIRKTLNRVKLFHFFFWLIPLLMVGVGESCNEWVGRFADDVRGTYISETIVILLTCFCVPFALKLFSWVMKNQVDEVSICEALRLYALWCGVRLTLLATPVVAGLWVYYSMLSTKALLCACIGFTASFFCMPGLQRLKRELHID